MKKVLVVFGLLVLATVANAQAALPSKHLLPLELCFLEAGQDEAGAETFEDLGTLDINQISGLSPFLLGLTNQHLVAQGYTDKALSFAEIKALFGEGGPEEYNDLYIVTFKSKDTGRVYIQVKTWPGDNPYGLIFDAATGKLIAYNGDDSISFATLSGGQVSCYELGK